MANESEPRLTLRINSSGKTSACTSHDNKGYKMKTYSARLPKVHSNSRPQCVDKKLQPRSIQIHEYTRGC
ncbi:hypothetical protein E2C01_035204 [Portunus trituberculatus]|uniref:Uncharacterized protein n=1 Tax=Portunus trituberculatus TaxID=210409 RepID=A0A5B7FAU5_PORTR|nr:hypothetical protein [Portunus trituberculatus]